MSVSYSRFDVEADGVRAIVRVPLDDLDLLLRLDRDFDNRVSIAELEQARPTLARYFADKVAVSAGGERLIASLEKASPWTDQDGALYVEAALAFVVDPAFVSQDVGPAPAGRKTEALRDDSMTIQLKVLLDLYPGHRNLSEIRSGDRREEFVFQRGNTYSVPRAGGSSWRTAKSFMRLGIEHIFTGYDHILFLFGVLLVGGGLRNLILIVTSFTIAHSLTLSLATVGVVHPAAWTVEAAIALSIAYVGLENLLVKDVRHRWRITFAFGLIHGLGFANVLRDMNLPRSGLVISLLTFNAGVEIGQMAIVALMVPFLRYLERTPYRVPITRAASAVIVAVGLFWFWQRVA